MPELSDLFTKKLRLLVGKGRSFSITAIHKATKIDRPKIYRYLDGQPVSLDDAEKIVKALNTSLGEFLGLTTHTPEDCARALLEHVKKKDPESRKNTTPVD